MKPNFVPWHQYYTTFFCRCKDPIFRAIDETRQQPSPQLRPSASLLDAQPPSVQEAFQFPLATAMHEGGNPRFGKFELLNLAGGSPAKRTLLVTAISRCQKTTHPKRPAIKLPTMELPKLTKSLLSQRQPRRWRAGWPQRWILASVSFWHCEQ